MMLSSQHALYYFNNGDVTIVATLSGKSIAKWYDSTFAVAGAYKGLRSFSKNLVRKQKLSNKNPNLFVYREEERFHIRNYYELRTNCIYRQEEGKVWAGLENGLICLTKDTMINLDVKYPIFKERIVDIKGDSLGTLYIATNYKGIIIFKKNGEIIRLSKSEGLSSSVCHKIEIDGNILWLGTNAGVDRVTLDKNYRPKKIHTFNTSYGLLSNHVNALLIKGEEIWIGTSNGLSVINKNTDDFIPKAPATYITEVTVNNQPIDILAKKEFHYTENNLKISYVGLSYKKGDINYNYTLSSAFDVLNTKQQWHETRNTTVDFSSLAPGSYTFAVMAQSTKNGIWSKPVTYNLTIQTPYWKTQKFIILSYIASAILAISVWRYGRKLWKRRSVEKRKLQLAELKSIRSQLNYHFMSNAFNSLQGLFFSENGVDQYIGKFSKLMRFTLENSERHQICLSDELEYLKLYCEIEQLRVGDKFTFTIECDETMNTDNILIPALTLQPFIENAIWHGIMPKEGVGTIKIKILPKDSFSFKIVIEDDGIGINASLFSKAKTNRKSFGTKLIFDRFEIIKLQSKNHCNLLLEDRSDIQDKTGTRVSITFPYTYE